MKEKLINKIIENPTRVKVVAHYEDYRESTNMIVLQDAIKNCKESEILVKWGVFYVPISDGYLTVTFSKKGNQKG